MITFKAKDFDYSGTKDRVEGECLSTDTKPTTYANGSCLIEMDTGDKFMFDEANATWLNITNPGGGGDPEVWLVSDTYEDGDGQRYFTLSNVDATDHMAELNANPENYQIYLNGVALPFVDIFAPDNIDKTVTWTDTETMQEATMLVIVDKSSEGVSAFSTYTTASTAPTSVEVSVKAK